jgi:hypothetical protein
MDLPITLLAVGANGLIGLGLSYLVVSARGNTGVWHGDSRDEAAARFAAQGPKNVVARAVFDQGSVEASVEPLQRRIRVHGNFTEYVPLGLLFVAALEASGHTPWAAAVTALLLTVGRIIYSIGVLRVYGPSPLRFTGFMMTWLSYLIGSLACIREGAMLLAGTTPHILP